MKLLINALVYSNFWVASCFSVLTFGLATHFHIQNAETYAIFHFFCALSAYQFHRYFITSQQITNRNRWIKKHTLWNNLVTIFGVLGVFYSVFFINWQTSAKIIIACNLIIVLYYVLPLPFFKTTFRSIPYLKTTVISASWTTMLIVPMVNNSIDVPLLIVGFVVLQTIGQLIYFDCRDFIRDEKSLRTIPQLIGINTSRLLAVILFVLSLIFLVMTSNYSPYLLFVLFANLLGMVIKKTNQETAIAEFIWDLPFFITGIYFAGL